MPWECYLPYRLVRSLRACSRLEVPPSESEAPATSADAQLELFPSAPATCTGNADSDAPNCMHEALACMHLVQATWTGSNAAKTAVSLLRGHRSALFRIGSIVLRSRASLAASMLENLCTPRGGFAGQRRNARFQTARMRDTTSPAEASGGGGMSLVGQL